jgi:hypothetical protein
VTADRVLWRTDVKNGKHSCGSIQKARILLFHYQLLNGNVPHPVMGFTALRLGYLLEASAPSLQGRLWPTKVRAAVCTVSSKPRNYLPDYTASRSKRMRFQALKESAYPLEWLNTQWQQKLLHHKHIHVLYVCNDGILKQLPQFWAVSIVLSFREREINRIFRGGAVKGTTEWLGELK